MGPLISSPCAAFRDSVRSFVAEGRVNRLDGLALRITSLWGLDKQPKRVDIGVNKATWRVGGYWLSSGLTDEKDRIVRSQRLLARLSEDFCGVIAVPRFVPVDSGFVVEAHGRVWWLTEHIEGRQPDPSCQSDMEAVARGLSMMHDLLREVPRSYSVSDDNFEQLFRYVEQMVSDVRLKFSSDDLAVARHAAEIVVEHLGLIRRSGMQITHGDPSNPNLLMDMSGSRLIGALDWDNAHYDHVLSDIAVVAQTILFRSHSDEQLDYLREVIAAYVSSGGTDFTIDEVLTSVIMVLFEAISHHGNRYVLGHGSYEHVGDRVANMRIVLGLMNR